MRALFIASNLNSQSSYHRTSLHKSLINAISFKLEWFIRLAISIKGLAKLECLALRVIGSRIVLSLLQATAYIFTDMQTSDRHRHAHECYNVTAKRCGALLQWINQVKKSHCNYLISYLECTEDYCSLILLTRQEV